MTFLQGEKWREQGLLVWQPKWLIWMAAAETLPYYERHLAYRDIALLTGLTRGQVEDKAAKLRKTNKRYKVAAE